MCLLTVYAGLVVAISFRRGELPNTPSAASPGLGTIMTRSVRCGEESRRSVFLVLSGTTFVLLYL